MTIQKFVRLRRILITAWVGAWVTFPALTGANILGTDTQNFNPTTNGIDFVTVQSSETLQPGILNVGLFFNYASNTLAYSRDLPGTPLGQKPGDRLLGMDLSAGLGLTDNWDIGISLPAVLSQELDRTFDVAKYGATGVTELKLNTKYRFFGDDKGGLAAVASANFNFIKDNPFTGSGSGPTLNFELAADTTFKEKYSLGLNLGYRKRSPGEPIPAFPFTPFKDQWIASAAGSYLISSIDSKIIAEIFASRPTQTVSYDQDRSQSTLESLLGLKHDVNSSLAVHVGAGTQLERSTASPDWRVYAGLNYAMGPLWTEPEEKSVEVVKPSAPPTPSQSETLPTTLPAPPVVPLVAAAPTKEVVRIKAELLFEFDSAELRPEARKSLDRLIRNLRESSFKSMVVEGHTDSVGKLAYNLDLSQRRADTVRKDLIEVYNIDQGLIQAKGLGPNMPIGDNGNFQGRKANRRVEFVIER